MLLVKVVQITYSPAKPSVSDLGESYSAYVGRVYSSSVSIDLYPHDLHILLGFPQLAHTYIQLHIKYISLGTHTYALNTHPDITYVT